MFKIILASKGWNPDGEGSWSVIWNFKTALLGPSISVNEIPKEYKSYNNYPNPFNLVIKIKFDIPFSNLVDRQGVLLTVFGILGKEVTILVKEQLKSGRYEVTFDGSNLSSWIYFYRLKAGYYTEIKNMVFIK